MRAVNTLLYCQGVQLRRITWQSSPYKMLHRQQHVYVNLNMLRLEKIARRESVRIGANRCRCNISFLNNLFISLEATSSSSRGVETHAHASQRLRNIQWKHARTRVHSCTRQRTHHGGRRRRRQGTVIREVEATRRETREHGRRSAHAP